MSELLAVVEVDPDKKIQCCAPNCKRSVYKRIHVVRSDSGEIQVLGERCFSLIYGNGVSGRHGDSSLTSRKLTEDERQLLINNTQELIAKLKRMHAKTELKPEHQNPINNQVVQDEIIEHAFSREVKCHYCRKPMKTHLEHVPAIGFKCKGCKSINAVFQPRRKY